MEKYFDFKDINLVPQMGIVQSRDECKTQVQLGKYEFDLPICPANMESVVNLEICEKLAKKDYFYTMHRFGVDQKSFIRDMNRKKLVSSISIGVNQEAFLVVSGLLGKSFEGDDHLNIPDFITIDIAHGHSALMKAMIQYIRSFEQFDDTFIIAGNICTVQALFDLAQWGANAVKVGIAPGEVCTTAMETGFGSRGIQASIIKEIADNNDVGVKIIADGGIREHGDIAKALVMGADMVMIGGMLAAFRDSPGEVILDSKTSQWCKSYHGSASSAQKGKKDRIEGIEKLIPIEGRYIMDEYKHITESLQSSISYAGGNDLSIFNSTKFIIK